MKILSPLPSVFAKVSDLVDRDVTSDIEVMQAATFPLLELPQIIRNLGGNNLDVLTDTKFFFHELDVTNAAAVAQDLCSLGKGVWDISFFLQYSSNFQNFPHTAGGGFQFVDPVTGTQNFIAGFSPMNGQNATEGTRRIVTDRSDLRFRLTLGAAAVGQSHYVVLSAYFAKLA